MRSRSYVTPVTTVLSSFLTPSLDPDAASQMRQTCHARRRSASDAKHPSQSSANAACATARHPSSSASPPCPHSFTPLHTAFIATMTVFRSSLALSGDSTQPIKAPIQFLNPSPRPAALS